MRVEISCGTKTTICVMIGGSCFTAFISTNQEGSLDQLFKEKNQLIFVNKPARFTRTEQRHHNTQKDFILHCTVILMFLTYKAHSQHVCFIFPVIVFVALGFISQLYVVDKENTRR